MNEVEVQKYRDDTPLLKEVTFLNHAAISPISQSVKEAMMRGADNLMNVRPLSPSQGELEYARSRSLAGALVGAAAEQVAFVQNTSIGMSMVALGIDFAPGENIVVPSMDFPSNFLPWIQLESKGIEVRRVDAPNGMVTAALLSDYVDDKTRVVALSHVQYYNGYKVQLAPIAELCRRHNSLFVVDGTQSVGAMSLNVHLEGIDVLVVASHKWMLGPIGTGFMVFSEKAMNLVQPRLVGWLSVKEPFEFHRTLDYLDSAQRFEAGSENSIGIYGLLQRLTTIHEIGIEVIERRILTLVEHVTERLEEAGLEVIYCYKQQETSGILLFKNPKSDSANVQERLTRHRFITSVRAGSIRVSPHYHNTIDELDNLVQAARN